MRNKLFIGVVTVIAAGAFAVTPMPAQATPGHYFIGGLGAGARIPAGERVATIAWGTLSLANLTTGAKVTCRDVIGGVVENPAPGGEIGPAGIGETQWYGAYECESEACETPTGMQTYISVFPEGSEAPFPETGTGTMTAPNVSTEEPLVASGNDLRWKSTLIEEGTKVRQESEKVKLDAICHVVTGFNAKTEPEYGAQVPEVSKGNNRPLMVTHCCTPASPPELSFDSGSGSLVNEKGQKVKTEGSLKTLGYNLEEVINAKQG